MSVLVTGATGTVGSVVVSQLVAAGLDVRAFTRSAEKATLAPGVTPFMGELLDVDALRAAVDGVEAVFLLSPVVPDELNVTISTLNLTLSATACSRSRSGKRVFPLPMFATSPRWPCSKSSAGWPPGKRSVRKSTRWSPRTF
jgi:nucleoside-diphosphate-sugar epimerase